MSGAPSRMPKGIQFVKSSETLNPLDRTSAGPSQSSSNSQALLPHPNQSTGNVSSITPRPQFGGPAINYGFNPSTNNVSNRMSGKYNQTFVKSGENYSSLKNEQNLCNNSYQMPGSTDLNKKSKPFIPPIPKTTTAEPMCSHEEYRTAWKEEKDPFLGKIRKLAYEIVNLKSDRPNAMDKLHSAANRVPIRIEFNTEPIMGAKNSRCFVCYVFIESVDIASGRGSKIRSAKAEAYETALQKILMPHMRIVSIDPKTRELEVSESPFTAPPRKPSKVPLQNNSVSCQHKESNLEAAGLKRRHNEYKNLDEFVIVEPKVEIPDCTAAHTLRRSADFNHMLLEYEYFFKGESARCILKIENEVLADVNGVSKVAAKNTASVQALARLKKFCWIIKTKRAVDSESRISKDEIFNELNEQSESITNDNIGNQMLRKMGWSGGGVGKDGDGIAEPVSLKSVLNREGLGLGASKGITDDFRRRIKEVIENYASSDNQEDLVFSHDFRLEERQIIHDECRRLNLRSKSRGKGQKRYLCVRRKRSVNQLFDHLMSVGGETTRYQLVPPGADLTTPTPVNTQGSDTLTGPRNNFVTSSSGTLLPTPSPMNGMMPAVAGVGGGFPFGSHTGSVCNGASRLDKASPLNYSGFGKGSSKPPSGGNASMGGSGYNGSYSNQQGRLPGSFGNDGGVRRQAGQMVTSSANSSGMGWGGGGGPCNQPGYFQNGSPLSQGGDVYQFNGSGGFNNQASWDTGNRGQNYGNSYQGQGFSRNDSGQGRGGYRNEGQQGQGYGISQGVTGSGVGSSYSAYPQQQQNGLGHFRGGFHSR